MDVGSARGELLELGFVDAGEQRNFGEEVGRDHGRMGTRDGGGVGASAIDCRSDSALDRTPRAMQCQSLRRDVARRRDGMPDRRRELVVVVNPDVAAARDGDRGAIARRRRRSALHRTGSAAGAAMRPLFGASEDRLEQAKSALAAAGVDSPAAVALLRRRCRRRAARRARGRDSQRRRTCRQPTSSPRRSRPGVNDMQPKAAPAPGDHARFQRAAGISRPGARRGRRALRMDIPGGRGAGVQIIDIEADGISGTRISPATRAASSRTCR